MNCEAAQSGNIAGRYARGQLSEAERDAFEEHYYVCPDCFDEVRALQAMQRGAPASDGRRGGRRVLWIGAAAAVLAALAIAPRMWRSPVSPIPVAKREPAATPDRRAETLRLLARVDAPRYTAPVLRGSSNAAEGRFRDAMASYTRGNYAGAAAGLKSALSAGSDSAALRFYLGVCDLLTGQAEDAAGHLRRADGFGQTAYQEEARFFLAKALLATGDTQGAIQALERTAALAGDREAEARMLLEQVRALPGPR